MTSAEAYAANIVKAERIKDALGPVVLAVSDRGVHVDAGEAIFALLDMIDSVIETTQLQLNDLASSKADIGRVNSLEREMSGADERGW